MRRSHSDGQSPPADGQAVPSGVGAVIAAHRPGPELLTAVTAAVPQVTTLVVVVDEHPVSGSTAALVAACREHGAQVVHHEANRGIGAALNTGVAHLAAQPPLPTHVLTLDQDSALPRGYVDALLQAVRDAEDAGVRVGMAAPEAVGSIIRIRRPGRRRGQGEVAIGGEPIQSGLLVPMAVLTALGGFDEGLFIDGVDTDFYLRASDRGLRCVIAPGTRLGHRLGHAITAGDRELPLLVASTFRYHYQWRNLVALVRRHGRRHPVWAARAVLRAARHLLLVTVLTPGRVARLREARSGLRAGLRAETGKRPDPGPVVAGEH